MTCRMFAHTPRLLAALLCVLTCGLVQAQDVPYTGVVFQDDTHVHSGAGRVYYRVGELGKGDIVRVEEVIFGWNRITPPEGVHSYISRAFVDAKGDGQRGVVNKDRAEVKAASIKGPGESYRVQCELEKGDTVEIIAAEGSFYKIKPPASASVFLPPGSVRRSSAMQGADTPVATPVLPEKPDAEPQTTTPSPEKPEAADAPETTDEPQVVFIDPPKTGGDATEAAATASNEDTAATPDDAPAASDTAAEAAVVAPTQSLKSLEAEMMPLWEKPLEEQPLDEMIAAYQAMGEQAGVTQRDQRIIDARLRALMRSKQLRSSIEEIEKMQAEAAQAGAPDPIDPNAPAIAPDDFDAVGRLMASSLYNGEHLPRMFRLVDVANGQTLGYVRPGGLVDATEHLGEVVGIVGPKAFEPSIKLNVFSVEQITALDQTSK